MTKNGKNHVLVADIGGTNSTFAIVDEAFNIVFQRRFDTKRIADFKDPLNDMLNDENIKKLKVENACFGVAGPVSKDRKVCKGTNIGWEVDVEHLLKTTPLKKIVLINDFEAIGFGVGLLDKNNPSQIVKLNDKPYDENGVCSIIGAGTGLGVGILIYKNGNYYPLPSEGGHTAPAISDEFDFEIFNYIKSFDKQPDMEDFVSGRGLVYIYNFLQTKNYEHKEGAREEIARAEEKSAAISKYGISRDDPLCTKAVEIFTKFYARAARNLALITLPSILYIAGGIAPKNIKALKEYFMEEFVKHGVHSEFLKNLPVFVIMDYGVGILGAANVAVNNLL